VRPPIPTARLTGAPAADALLLAQRSAAAFGNAAGVRKSTTPRSEARYGLDAGWQRDPAVGGGTCLPARVAVLGQLFGVR
jgi:hypothetical protein